MVTVDPRAASVSPAGDWSMTSPFSSGSSVVRFTRWTSNPAACSSAVACAASRSSTLGTVTVSGPVDT